MAATLTTEECRQALRRRYSQGDGYVYLEELQNVGGVPNSPGVRRCDFWAMCTYASRGFETHGVEIKVNRSDLRNELQDPAKAEGLAEFCDYWWLAVGDREILDGLRVPKTWGVLWPRGDNLVQKEEPDRTPSSNQWNRAFCAALVKKCWKPYGTSKISQLRREHREELRDVRRKARQNARESEREKWQELRERVEAFERASGIDLDAFSFRRYGLREDVGAKLGKAVRVLLNGGADLETHLDQLQLTAEKARERADKITETADGLERFVDDLQERQLELIPDQQ